jgi:5-methylcytosine-specific restriction endonuclease McrA
MNGNVLVLNQNYEPMSVCSVQKAIILLFLHKAEMVEKNDGKVLKSPSKSIPYPSIVRLSFYRKVPYKRAVLSRKNIFRRDNFRCQYCGKYDGNLTLDHVVPKSKNGEDSWENLVTACIVCNNKKGDRSPEEAKMSLFTVPRRPNHVMFIKHCHGDIDEKWKPYLFMTD